jgi:transcriptional regulator with GAF, ATPase, and Fis domain
MRIEEYDRKDSPLVSREENLAGTSRQPDIFPNHPFDDSPTMDELQRRYLRYLLEKTRGRIGRSAGAAGTLGMKRTTIVTRMKKLGLNHGKM